MEDTEMTFVECASAAYDQGNFFSNKIFVLYGSLCIAYYA